jgi:Putative addiction module component
MRDPQLLFAEVLALPEEHRADLVMRLSESLEADVHEDAEDTWALTVARRVREVRDGTAVTVSADEAFARAHQRIANRR